MILSNDGTVRRKQFKKIRDYICSECKLGAVWNNKPITLQLDHINGIKKDNHVSNLRWLCPNCHSQTDTFCSKNHKNHKNPKNRLTYKMSVIEKIMIDLKSMPDKDFQEFISKNSYTDIAAKYHTSPTTVERVFFKMKIKKPKKGISKLKYVPSKEELEKMIQKKSFTSIGKAFGISDNGVRHWCSKLGVDMTKALNRHKFLDFSLSIDKSKL